MDLTEQLVDPLDLHLDPQNPRLPPDVRGRLSQGELVDYFVRNFQPEEIGQSISTVGYQDFDPLIVVEENGSLIVLEGNRRLAALKLLRDPSQAPERHRGEWEAYAEDISNAGDLANTIQKVRVRVAPDRQTPEVEAYIGFRHVAGVRAWDALEKAGYIAYLVDVRGYSFERVGEMFGNRAATVERHYLAFQWVRQCRQLEMPGANRIKFGVLSRALQAPQVRKFLGLNYTGKPEDAKNPIRSEHESAASDFIVWLFGSDDQSPIVTDSRQLTRFGRVLESGEAVRYLRAAESPKLERAWQKAGGERETIVEALSAAADRLEEGVAIVSEHKEDTEVAGAVAQCSRFLAQILDHFPDERSRYFKS